MERFFYERTRRGDFHVYDRHRNCGDRYVDAPMAVCTDRDAAERIVSALNAGAKA